MQQKPFPQASFPKHKASISRSQAHNLFLDVYNLYRMDDRAVFYLFE